MEHPSPAHDTRNALPRAILKYLVICTALSALNFFTGGTPWVLWIWIAWGVGIILRAIFNSPENRDRQTDVLSPRRSFYRHLCVYFFVIGLLAATNYLHTPAYPWVLWPAAGWGLALALQAIDRSNTITSWNTKH